MQIILKVVLSIVIILVATAIAKKFPSTASLIGVMPLTGSLFLVWVYLENKGNAELMQAFAKGALWGILPASSSFLWRIPKKRPARWRASCYLRKKIMAIIRRNKNVIRIKKETGGISGATRRFKWVTCKSYTNWVKQMCSFYPQYNSELISCSRINTTWLS